jgi:CheY-like chemotaxis protein
VLRALSLTRVQFEWRVDDDCRPASPTVFSGRRGLVGGSLVAPNCCGMAPGLLLCGMGERFRVLVADDNHDAANSMAMLLELSGYQVEVAYDGEAALELAVRWLPHAAVLDLAMPRKSGYDVARAIRARLPHHVVLIAHSGQLTIRQRDMASASLFDLCLTKGAEIGDLREQLEHLLKGRGTEGGPQDETNDVSGGGRVAPHRHRGP